MCGIAGVFYADATRPVDSAVLRRMGDSIRHRGPDAEGLWTEPGLGLVHRRLSIIDLAGGDQPIGNEDGSVQVVFNGEIYNYQSLRSSLESRGHRFRTQSDTEVLVHLYEEEEERLVERLRGMFAFALWDRKQRRLVLARDRVGIKPLYLYRDADKLLFGSELKAILAYPGIQLTVDPAAIEDYFTLGMVPGPGSIFRHVDKVPAAHVLVIDGEHLRRAPQRYWQLRLEPDYGPTVVQWRDALAAKLDETIRLHLLADVPVGAFLSGGLDSSVVVQACSGGTREPLQTFSMGFREESFNELPYARQVAELCGTQHAEETVTADAVALLDDLSRFYDEPFADSSAVPTFLVSRLARRSVKVVLSGDGGDEAFGGYARYAHDLKEAAIRDWLPAWFRRLAIGPLAQAWPKTDWLPRPLRARNFLTNLALDGGPAYANTLSVCRPPLRRQLLAQDLAASLNGHNPHQRICQAHATAVAGDDLAGMLAADVEVILPDDFLVKVDRASMAHGLEVRPPLLDHELLELAARIPSNLKVHNGETKWILKETVKDRLPPEVVRRKKHGFELPIDAWLRGPLREMFKSVVLDPGSRVAELVNQPLASKLFQAHSARTGRHGAVLWSILVLAKWAERYLGSRRATVNDNSPRS
jgi:asparagine synthase (glutamine-hydrolysing)